MLKVPDDVHAGIDHAFGEPTGYGLAKDGNHFVPKVVIGIAHRHLTGRRVQALLAGWPLMAGHVRQPGPGPRSAPG